MSEPLGPVLRQQGLNRSEHDQTSAACSGNARLSQNGKPMGRAELSQVKGGSLHASDTYRQLSTSQPETPFTVGWLEDRFPDLPGLGDGGSQSEAWMRNKLLSTHISGWVAMVEAEQ